jgi:pyruvate dehydrogenase E1 component
MYLLEEGEKKAKQPTVQLLGSGSILQEVRAAAEILRSEYGVNADIWAVTSYNQLTRDGWEIERENMLNPEGEPREAYVTQMLKGREGPVISSSDYMKNYANQIRKWVPQNYEVLGTDGFGRSDSRAQLRHFFEVDRKWVTVAALKALANEGSIKASVVTEAIKKFDLDMNKPNPMTV